MDSTTLTGLVRRFVRGYIAVRGHLDAAVADELLASLRTLPIGLQTMVVGDLLPWGQLMAASLLTAIPVAGLYFYMQRYLVGGLTLGSVKG